MGKCKKVNKLVYIGIVMAVVLCAVCGCEAETKSAYRTEDEQESGQSAGDGSSEISGEKQGRTNADDMVYGSYQNKTWVVDGENFYDGNGYSITLYITQITDEIVEGHIALNGMVGYNSDGTWEDFYPEFRGTVHDGIAHCEYVNKKGEVS